MKLEIQTTSVKQEANNILDTKAKTLWYLIIGEKENQVIINVGEKTFDKVNNAIKGGKK